MKRQYQLAVVAIGLMIGIGLILFIIGKEPTITTGVQFYLSPTDTTIRINNQVVKPNGKLQLALEPGTYDIEFVRLHFASKTERIVVEDGSLTDAPVLLRPSNEQGDDFLRKEIEQRAREQVAYRLSLQTSEKINEKNPLVTLLPVFNSEFRIDYGVSQSNPDDPTAVTIFITTDSAEQRQAALAWIQSKGFDPANLDIVYRFYDEL